MAHKGLLKGPKFNGKHSTVIESAYSAVEAARDCDLVTKVAIGLITPTSKGKERVKFTSVSGGLKLQVRGSHNVQLFWIYTTEPESTIEFINERWKDR